MSNPWDRQEGESAKAYSGFCHYRDLPLSRRSIALAYTNYKSLPKAIKGQQVPGFYKNWSSAFGWVKRAHAWDEHRLASELEATENHRKDLLVRGYRLMARILEENESDLHQMTPDEKTRLFNSLQKMVASYENLGGDTDDLPTADDEPDMIEVAPTSKSNGEIHQ